MLEAGYKVAPKTGISDHQLIFFIAFMVEYGKANQDPYPYKTIAAYLSMGPRQLSLRLLGAWTPLAERPLVKAYLTGARRLLEDESKHKLPITPEILQLIYDSMGRRAGILCSNTLLVEWTLMPVAFWTFLRKDNLVVGTVAKVGPQDNTHVVRRGYVTFDTDGTVWLSVG